MEALRAAWRQKRFELIVSEAALQELERVLHYGRVQKLLRFSESELSAFVADIRTHAAQVEGLYEVEYVQADPDDNIILACALEADADYLVSEDHHLRELKYYHGVQIIGLDHFRQIIGV